MDAYIHIISSDEPLLLLEKADQVITCARNAGMTEREVVEVSEKQNWDSLLAGANSLSLFAQVRLLELRFNKMPNPEAQAALLALAQSADASNWLLVRLPKLDKRQKSAKWFSGLTKNGQFSELWPPKPHEYRGWLKQRAIHARLTIDDEALALLAEQCEGNLLAAKQALDKLSLLVPSEVIDREVMAKTVADSARYSVFLCLDEAIAGQGLRSVKILKRLKQEGVPPILVLSQLTREVENCQLVAQAVSRGENAQQALAKSYLWDGKKRLICNAAQRLPLVVWQRLLVRCAFLDRLLKGQAEGNLWQELELCLWMLAGTRIWGRK